MNDISVDEKYKFIMNSDFKEPFIALVNTYYNDIHISMTKYHVIVLINYLLLQINYDKIFKLEDFKVIYQDIIKIDIDLFVDNNLQLLQFFDIDIDEDFKYGKKRPNRHIINVIDIIVKYIGYKSQKYLSCATVDGKQKSLAKYRLIKF
jgi:hypothetical protein